MVAAKRKHEGKKHEERRLAVTEGLVKTEESLGIAGLVKRGDPMGMTATLRTTS